MERRRVITVCDVCETEEGVQSYEVRKGTRKKKVDLCAEHNGPLESYFPATAAKKAAAPRGRKPRVATIEEIEALKKPAKKRAPASR